MHALKIVGCYASDKDKFDLKVHTSDNISKEQIEKICSQMIKDDILNSTYEFDDGNFMFFKRDEGIIRFIEGHQDDYTYLKNTVTSQCDGSILFEENDKNTEKKKQVNEFDLIHHSLLPPLSSFEKKFQKAEIYFRPFEAPGGDFYWLKNYEDKTLVVLGDCTGHGMQGAMIGMSVMTLLKQHFVTPPDSLKDAIYQFNAKMQDIVESENSGMFGVELGAILIDWSSNQVEFMGSGVSMITRSEEETKLYKSRNSHFQTNKQDSCFLTLKKKEQIVLFSDGITDQFDANDTRRLSNKIVKLIDDLPFPLSISDFEYSFNDFRRSTPQLDDQTMLVLSI